MQGFKACKIHMKCSAASIRLKYIVNSAISTWIDNRMSSREKSSLSTSQLTNSFQNFLALTISSHERRTIIAKPGSCWKKDYKLTAKL